MFSAINSSNGTSSAEGLSGPVGAKRIFSKGKGALKGQGQGQELGLPKGQPAARAKFGVVMDEAVKYASEKPGAGIIDPAALTGNLPDDAGTNLPQIGKTLPDGVESELSQAAIGAAIGEKANSKSIDAMIDAVGKLSAQPLISASIAANGVKMPPAIEQAATAADQASVKADKSASKGSKFLGASTLPAALKDAVDKAQFADKTADSKGRKSLDPMPIGSNLSQSPDLTPTFLHDAGRADMRLESAAGFGAAKDMSAPQTLNAKDFDALIDRLTQAREQAQIGSSSVSMSMKHGEFGSVNLRFEQSAAGLSVAMSSLDPDFATAAQNAMAEQVNAAENTSSSDNNTQKRDAESRQDTQSSQNGGNFAGSYQQRGESTAFARRADQYDSRFIADASEESRENELNNIAEQARRAASGLYI